jgi:hypothetical protein
MWEMTANGAGSAGERDAAGREDQRGVAVLGFEAGGRAARVGLPDPEPVDEAKRRKVYGQYKLETLEQADACTEPGEIGDCGRWPGCRLRLHRP